MIRRWLCVMVAACGTATAPRPAPPPVAATRPAKVVPVGWSWANPVLTDGPLHAVWASDAVVIAVGANGAIVRSSDAGASWARVASGTQQELVSVSGGARGEVFAAGAHGTLVRSSDRGVTWNAVKLPAASDITAMWSDGTNVVVSADYKKWLRSSDGGASWQDVAIDSGCGQASRFFGDGDRVWAAASSCVELSTDAGASWRVVAHVKDGRFSAFYRDGAEVVAISVLSSSSDEIRTHDNGATWSQPRYIEGDVHDAWGDTSGALLVESNGQLVRTVDHGVRYERHAEYETPTLHHGVTGARGTLIVVSDDGVIRRSVDGGTTWAFANALTDEFVKEIWFASDGTAYATGTRSYDAKPFAWRSSDAGVTWQAIEAAPEHESHACVDRSGVRFRISGSDIERSEDGETWTAGRASSYTATPAGIVCAADGAIYVAQGLVVAISHDHGKSWTEHRNNDVGELTGIAVSGGAIVVSSEKGGFRSTDGGNTFKLVIDRGWRELVARGDEIWLRGDNAVARTLDGGATFAGMDLPITRTDMLAIDGHDHALLTGYPTTLLRYGPKVAPHLAAGPVAAATSPFAPAVATRAASDANDAQAITAVAAEPETPIAPLLARIRRGKSPAVAGWLTLDTTIAEIAKLATIGKRTCERVVGRYCPGRNYQALLESRREKPTWVGSFADDKLYQLETSFYLAKRIEDDSQRRIATRAFEQVVQKALGPATEIRREPHSADTLELRRASWLAYGNELEVGFDVVESNITVRLSGTSVALELALISKDDAINAADQQKRAQAELRELCTCKHIRVGDTWPHERGNVMRMGMEPTYRVRSVQPAKCLVRMDVQDAFGGVTQEEHKCSDFVDPPGCPMCGN